MKGLAGVVLGAFLGTMFAGLVSITFMVGGHTHMHHDCPYMVFEHTICPMDLFQHLTAWESSFLALPFTLLFLLILLLRAIAPSLLVWVQFGLPRIRYLVKLYAPRTHLIDESLVRAFQELFSSGTLHTKRYRCSVT